MKNNKEDKLEINQENLIYYLNKAHGIDPDTLFSLKKTDEEKYFSIMNHTFKHTVNHWMDAEGNLTTEDPENQLFQFKVWGYPGYDSIASIEDLETHLKQALVLRNRKMKVFKEMMEQHKGKDNEIER